AVSGILVLRSFGIEEVFRNRMHVAAQELVENEEKRTQISNTAIVIRKVVQWLPNIMSAVYAVYLVSRGEISLGGLVAFILILNKFVDAFIGLPFCMVDASAGVVSVKRVEEILNADEEKNGAENTSLDTDVAIYFDKVDFGYTEEKQVLHKLSFEVKQGENVAFVGESGGGKSTIFHVLCGFYPKTSGQYQLLGRNIEDWNMESLREQISLVSQNVFLFPTTIEENVGYGKSDATHEEIVEACKKAEIHEFIMTLPQGYQTLVGERGAILSGGQKQRISIARAILKDAPILLLDEPTSALDVETESNIQDAINAVMEGRTCITIAHRLSTVVNADKIMVLKQGRVVESGTHEQLMELGQEYAKMYGEGTVDGKL
ncbi:MAG: ABC transporter ATP-binding protein, partial [Lachnospiraceae bacterium]|nr:ABC transporter ATP-binding protein [Lachnospiraceae bacterium]